MLFLKKKKKKERKKKYIYRFIVGNLESRFFFLKGPQLPHSEITLGNIVMYVLLEKKQSKLGIKLHMMFSNQTGYSF